MFLPIILWIMAVGIANSGRFWNHIILLLMLGRCYCLFLADVIANFDRCYFHDLGWCYCQCIVYGWCYCNIFWQMLLPIMWKMLNHMHLTFATSVMAGVIACWQMEWPLQGDLWQMLFAMGQRCYFSFSSEVLNRTSSQIWGRCYLPIFLLRGGLLTLIYNAFFCCSTEGLVLPPNYIEIINSDLVTTDVAMVKDWGGCLLMFSEPLCKSSRGFIYLDPWQITSATSHPAVAILSDTRQ